MDWKFVEAQPDGKIATLLILDGVPRAWEIGRGMSRKSGFPADAHLKMNPRYPKDKVLADTMHCSDGLWVASERMADLVSRFVPTDLELLPVKIIDHKGQPVAAPYFIIHLTRVVDAIDLERSEVTMNAITPDKISGVDRLEIIADRLPTDIAACRLAHIDNRTFVAPRLIEAITAAKMTGTGWTSVQEFTG